MNRLTFGRRILILAIMFAAALAAVLLVDPIPQEMAFHGLVDQRAAFGIPNFADVVSNLAFALVGALGLWTLLGPRCRRIFAEPGDAWPYALFFAGIALISLGSAWYHLAPDNDRLFWDRLPMTIAFMALFAAFVADRIDRRAGIVWLLPLLLIAGAASVIYWDWTEAQGRGDLRFYGMVQFFPMAALPVLCLLFPKARYTGGGYLVWVIAWYAVAKLCELFDGEIFALLGDAISGHSLKHLTSAIAVYMVVRMLITAPQRRT